MKSVSFQLLFTRKGFLPEIAPPIYYEHLFFNKKEKYELFPKTEALEKPHTVKFP